MSKELKSAIDAYTKKFGEEKLLSFLRREISDGSDDVLTIIADRGLHHIPNEICIGETYVFSNEQIPTASDSSAQDFFVEKLTSLAKVLKSKNWKRVRIIVSGHALLSMQIKLLVYRILHIDSEDIGYFGADGYRTVALNMRRDILLRLD